MFSDPMATRPVQGAPRVSAIETGTKLYISNLDYGVSNDDIKVNTKFLFPSVSDVVQSVSSVSGHILLSEDRREYYDYTTCAVLRLLPDVDLTPRFSFSN